MSEDSFHQYDQVPLSTLLIVLAPPPTHKVNSEAAMQILAIMEQRGDERATILRELLGLAKTS
jgi:hypothetical protein